MTTDTRLGVTRELNYEDYTMDSVDCDISEEDGKKEFTIVVGDSVVDDDGNEEESLSIEISFTRDELESVLKKFVEVREQIATRAAFTEDVPEQQMAQPAAQPQMGHPSPQQHQHQM